MKVCGCELKGSFRFSCTPSYTASGDPKRSEKSSTEEISKLFQVNPIKGLTCQIMLGSLKAQKSLYENE